MTGKVKPTCICFDFDLWCYDIGFAAQQKDGTLLSFEWVVDVIETRVEEIKQRLGIQEHYGYLTGKGNFREQVATSDVYKGNRKSPKPRYYQPIRDYLYLHHNAAIVDGMEADDAISIDITKDPSIVCVSRDKDLRQVEGWHYGYPVGKQAEFPLTWVDHVGHLELNTKRKLVGTGLKFFFSQVLTGDTTDNYKGLTKVGPVKAYEILGGIDDPDVMYDTVLDMFNNEQHFKEQCILAWMLRTPEIFTLDNIQRGFYEAHKYKSDGRDTE